MGEVDAVIPEKSSDTSEITSTASIVVNGDINGVCKTSESMDVDTEDDSQISSENGGVTAAEETESEKITNKKNVVINKNTECSSSSNSSSSTSSSNSSSGTNSTNLKENLATATMTATTPSSSSNSQCENIAEIDDNSQKTIKSNCSSKETNEEKLEKNGPVQRHLENEKEMIEKVQNEIESDNKKTSAVENDSKNKNNDSEKMEVDTSTLSSPKSVKDSSKKEEILQKQPVEEELAVANDIKSNEKENVSSQSSVKSISEELDKSDPKTSKTESSVNPIEVDAKLDTSVKNSKISEDDDAVVIPSDSESDSQEDSTTNCNTTTTSDTKTSETTKKSLEESRNKTDDANSKVDDDDVVEVLSDKDDCVVIEDDDKKDNTVRRTQRQRKSASKARDYNSFDDDDDDDVTEIVDDSQPPLKRPRTSDSSILSQPIGQIGQITIRDARSLMATPYQDNAAKQNFNHNFPQKTNISTQPVGQNSTSTKSNATPFGIMPVGLQAQNVFPVNIRPALAPISSSSPKMMSTSITPAVQSNLLSESPVLPNLTDDMFVLEAPSFIVPYIYEKPPSENLKEVVAKLAAEVKELEKEKEVKEKDDKKEEEEGKKDGSTEETKSESDDSKKDKRRRKKPKNPDDSWGESDESTDDDASDAETRTKVLIKEAKNDITSIVTNTEALKQLVMGNGDGGDKKSENYFDSPLGKFFIDIGIGLVQEYVQADLLRQQKRKRDKAKGNNVVEIEKAINLLKQNLQTSKDRNKPFKFEIKRCTFCNFKSESTLALAHHYETPHMRQGIYRCNFCPFEVRPPHDILFHMEAVHNIKGRLEKAPSYHQCPNCPFEDNGKSKLARHLPVCAKKFRPEHNLLPPSDWEAPAKIPRIKPRHGLVGTATAYQAMAAQTAAQKAALVSFTQRAVTPNNNTNNAYMRNRGRPQQQQQQQITPIRPPAPVIPSNTRMRQVSPGGVVMPNVHMTGSQFIQVAGSNMAAILPNSYNTLALQQQQNTKKTGNGQPSISITPLPRQPNNQISGVLSNPLSLQSSSLSTTSASKSSIAAGLKPGQGPSGSKASFVICEICDGYIKDLEQLRNHMQWMHKVKIHPKMIYNRPPLNCQKCQFRFFTDQGLERHLLGSHGLVTSSMQEAANKGKDAGRCPVCGRMYQWKLLNHVSRDHHMTLKPAHLSYKCTVCTATFGMYKQFENHVYTAHSTVAKKAMDNKKNNSGGSSNNLNSGSSTSNQRGSTSLTSLSAGNDSLLKPLKINDEITIIPQPANKSRAVVNEMESHIID